MLEFCKAPFLIVVRKLELHRPISNSKREMKTPSPKIYISKKTYTLKHFSHAIMEPDVAYFPNSSSPMKNLLYLTEKPPHLSEKMSHILG